MVLYVFYLNDTATTEIDPLSLHDALPIYWRGRGQRHHSMSEHTELHAADGLGHLRRGHGEPGQRCEQPTSLPPELPHVVGLLMHGNKSQTKLPPNPIHSRDWHDCPDTLNR